MFELISVQSGPKLEEVRTLFREYMASLDFDLCFQSIDRELLDLPGLYALPDGRLFLALAGGLPAGCIALKRLEPGICEMKRLYVRPEYRRQQLGRAMAVRLIAEARFAGYQRMRLDTIARLMPQAMGLYQSLGFSEIPPYYDNPIPGATFLELELSQVSRAVRG
jgi:ribosomal protein S18 acetylase RimI-like enzyme